MFEDVLSTIKLELSWNQDGIKTESRRNQDEIEFTEIELEIKSWK